jgi:cytochrome P450
MPLETVVQIPRPILGDEFLKDPYPIYRKFLQDGPIHLLAIGPGIQAVFSYELVSTLARDPRLSSKRTSALLFSLPEEHRPTFAPLVKMLGQWLLFMDPPEHSRLRKLLNKGFSSAVAEMLRPRIQSLVDRMLDEIADKPEVELMSAFVHPFPAKVIGELLGIPERMHDDLIRWSDAIATLFGHPQRTVEHCSAAQEALLALTDFFREAVAARRLDPGDDLISLLLEIESDGETLTEDELYAQCIMLLFAGHETTRNLIGSGVYTLLQHPEALKQVRADPGLIRSGVEELLRFQSPVQFMTRLVTEEIEIEGVRLEAGKPILLMLGAANRDPKRFKNPDTLDLARSNNAHLGFGAGAHFCIGNQIARLEAQTAILKIVQRFPQLRFCDEAPQWAQNYILRGFKSFPVALH